MPLLWFLRSSSKKTHSSGLYLLLKKSWGSRFMLIRFTMASLSSDRPNKSGRSSQRIVGSCFNLPHLWSVIRIRSSFSDHGSSMMLLSRWSHGLQPFAPPLVPFQRPFFEFAYQTSYWCYGRKLLSSSSLQRSVPCPTR